MAFSAGDAGMVQAGVDMTQWIFDTWMNENHIDQAYQHDISMTRERPYLTAQGLIKAGINPGLAAGQASSAGSLSFPPPQKSNRIGITDALTAKAAVKQSENAEKKVEDDIKTAETERTVNSAVAEKEKSSTRLNDAQTLVAASAINKNNADAGLSSAKQAEISQQIKNLQDEIVTNTARRNLMDSQAGLYDEQQHLTFAETLKARMDEQVSGQKFDVMQFEKELAQVNAFLKSKEAELYKGKSPLMLIEHIAKMLPSIGFLTLPLLKKGSIKANPASKAVPKKKWQRSISPDGNYESPWEELR